MLYPTPKRFALSAPILTFSSVRYVPREGFTLEDILVIQMGIFSKRGVWLLPECYRNVISFFVVFSHNPPPFIPMLRIASFEFCAQLSR